MLNLFKMFNSCVTPVVVPFQVHEAKYCTLKQAKVAIFYVHYSMCGLKSNSKDTEKFVNIKVEISKFWAHALHSDLFLGLTYPYMLGYVYMPSITKLLQFIVNFLNESKFVTGQGEMMEFPIAAAYTNEGYVNILKTGLNSFSFTWIP